LGREAVNSLLSSAEVGNAWRYNFSLPRLHGAVLKVIANIGTALSLTTDMWQLS
jgi:hypothetical protein